ncbi:chromosomal replication initiator protein DnaA [Corynebacterium mendelii]|uniref:Chromosomal replication initiator protein DnaA n=1 Tax=Corynebacterium mendelii TaxID=2765362 RepID=A0A939E0A5_9CORY|nr:chromosomal replication initiator protein DnaA [Corynebacterium mendelii]
MPDTDSTPVEIWRRVVAELVNRPDGAGAPISKIQEAYLRQVNPVAIVKGYAVLSVPSHSAKDAIENDLAQAISDILSTTVGVPCSLAVSVSRDQQHSPDNPAAAEQRTTHGWAGTTGYPAAPGSPATTAASDLVPGPGDHSGSTGGSAGPLPHPTAPGAAHGLAPGAGAASAGADRPRPAIPPQEAIRGLAGSQQDTGAPADTTGHGQPVARWTSANADDTAAGDFVAPTHSHGAPRLPREARAVDPDRDSSISARYTFDNFVTGPSNRFAQAAAIAVAEAPAQAFNPLFIWGGSGLGKTHLLHATGTYAKQLDQSLRVKYVSSEEFTNDYINSVRDDRQESFKRRYRNLDVLMVDDIQFLAGKEGTQEEFFHTFNALHQANKQIILSSDRPPKQLTTLHDRLRTRFQAGLIADIQPPDVETRIAILMRKAETDQIKVERDVLELIATNFESSIRELEGALIRVAASASLNKEPVNLETARTTLQDILPEEADVQITSQTIIEVAAEFFDMSVDVIIGTGKARARAHARQLAMYLCRELTDLSLPKIGQAFGGRDHTTVMYAEKKIKQEIKENRETYNQIQELTQLIKTRARS